MAESAVAAAPLGNGPVVDLLQHLVLASRRLLRATAGSVSLVDASGDRYAKMAERGTSCQLGSRFGLDEGITGQVVARRRPVTLAAYADVRAGHLAADEPARSGAVVAVPLWWRGDVVGVNVVFAGRTRRFTVSEIDDLEIRTQAAVPRLVRIAADDPAWAHLLRRTAEGGAPEADRVLRSPLTRREGETIALLARGLSNRQIAAALVLSPKTVEKHVAAVLHKTGTASRVAAVMTALDQGWLTRPGDRPVTG
jgi:DNA-binding CsgD family transcriptional regulator